MSPSRLQSALQWLVNGGTGGSSPGPGGSGLEAQLDEFEAVVATVAPPAEAATLEAWTPAEPNRADGRRPATGESPASGPRPLYQEYDMGERLTCSAEGITELVLETIADDARIRLVPDAYEIRVTISNESADDGELTAEGPQARLTGATAERIEVPAGIAIFVEEALGDVRVKGLSADLRIGTVEGDLRLEGVSGRVEIDRLNSDGIAEEVGALRLGSCAGDLRFSGGELEVETVAGDLRVERATSVRGAKTHGDLWVDRVEGDVELGLIHGDARVSNVGGAVTLGMVAGDLRVASARQRPDRGPGSRRCAA